jgi:protein-arginine kinase
LDSEAWQVGSPLWEVIKENGYVIPQVEEVGSQVEAIVFFVSNVCTLSNANSYHRSQLQCVVY